MPMEQLTKLPIEHWRSEELDEEIEVQCVRESTQQSMDAMDNKEYIERANGRKERRREGEQGPWGAETKR